MNAKRLLIIGLSVILLCSVVYGLSANAPDSKLPAEQIAELREIYPICGTNAPAGMFMRKVPINEVKDVFESFVYGEVVGDISTYTVNATLKNDALDAKRKANGIKDVFEFYEYTISVIEDTEGLYSKGQKITIASNTDFIDYNPKLSNGMKVVVPVVRDDKKRERNYYLVDGMYYVTEDGYALTAFEENGSGVSRSTTSGVKIETLLKGLKK